MTNEAQVLRLLRLENKLSMRKAGELAGVSDSMIAHVETGRVGVPKGDMLDKLLKSYGDIKIKSFYERVRRFKPTISKQEEAVEMVKRMNDAQIRLILPMLRGVLGAG